MDMLVAVLQEDSLAFKPSPQDNMKSNKLLEHSITATVIRTEREDSDVSEQVQDSWRS